ncbi:MAG: SAM-dependent chlorinase/fluorinase [Chloroflexi bacterium]|nr:SAM-dependent chlorinase/fluorinase [Chloroflexota bacterium]
MRSIISLTTDFGYDDPYVGVMKGVILGINSEASVVDLCHTIAPQDVRGAGLVLAGAYPYFPDGAIHLAVVDPGVGSGRHCLAARTRRALFVAPDNGLLTAVLAEDPPEEVVELTRSQYWLPQVSSTFHGRDILAPVAAHLSMGLPIEMLGPRIRDWVILPSSGPERQADGSLIGHIIRIDHFGNLITDLRSADLHDAATTAVFTIKDVQVVGLSRYYAERDGLMALVGSTGNIEIALRNGSAATQLSADRGDLVRVRWTA